MKNVRLCLFVVIAALVFGLVSTAQEKAGAAAPLGPTTANQAKFPVTLVAGEYDLMTIIMDFPVGATVPKHEHGGFVLVTVLSGEMTVKEKDGERTVKAGESWTEYPGYVHSVANAGTATTRLIVNMLLPKGAEATKIIK